MEEIDGESGGIGKLLPELGWNVMYLARTEPLKVEAVSAGSLTLGQELCQRILRGVGADVKDMSRRANISARDGIYRHRVSFPRFASCGPNR